MSTAPFNFAGTQGPVGDNILSWVDPPDLVEIEIYYEEPFESDNWRLLYAGSPITTQQMPGGSPDPTRARGRGKPNTGGAFGPMGAPEVVSF